MSRLCPGCGAAEARPFAEKNGHCIVRCRPCATLYTDDRQQRDYESGYAAQSEPPQFLARRLDDIIAGFAPWRRTGRLLDVGFGAGDLLQAAHRAGWTVSGVEVAAAAVQRARQRGIDAVHATLAEARYDAESFDVVIASELLEHVVETDSLLGEIHRVLRSGGLLWATTPHGRGLSARVLGAAWSVVNPPGHVQLFSIRGVRALLGRSGFEILSLAAEGANPREIVQRLRGGRMSPAQRMDAAYAVNAFFEEGRGRRAVKRALNGVLSLLRLGDSLKVRKWSAASPAVCRSGYPRTPRRAASSW